MGTGTTVIAAQMVQSVWTQFPTFFENYLYIFLLFAFALLVWGAVSGLFRWVASLVR